MLLCIAISLNAHFTGAGLAWADESVQSDKSAKPATAPDFEPILLKAVLNKTETMPVDLPAVLKLAQEQNLPIAIDTMDVKIAGSQVGQRVARLLPDIQASYNHSRFQGSIQIFGSQTIKIFQTRIQPQIQASWRIYPGGQDVFELLAAKRRKNVARSMLQSTVDEQLAQAAQEYYNLTEAYLQREIKQKSVEQTHEQVKLNQARYKVGVGTKLDWMQAQADDARESSELVLAHNNLSQAEQNLIERLNIDYTVHLTPIDMMGPTPGIVEALKRPLFPEESSSETLVEVAMKNSPDIRQAEQSVRVAKAELGAAYSTILPSVDLTAYANRLGPRIGELELGRFGGLAVQSNLLEGMGLAVPFRIQEKARLLKQRKLQLEQTTRMVESRVIKAFLDSQSFDQAIKAANQRLLAAQEQYRLADGRYRAGVGIQLDVLKAQTDLTAARANLVSATMNYNRAQVRLMQALGQVTPEKLLEGLSTEQLSALAVANKPFFKKTPSP